MDMRDTRWWSETMEYIRVVPGKVYKDQLLALVRERMTAHGVNAESELRGVNEENIADFLNGGGDLRYYLKMDPVTGGIYTVPSRRRELDRLLFEADSSYKYNKYLYEDAAPEFIGGADMAEVARTAVTFSPETGELEIDLKRLAGEEKVVDSFDINELTELVGGEVSRITRFAAQGVVFTGVTNLAFGAERVSAPPVTGGIALSEATFTGPVRMGNMTLDFAAGEGGGRVDFRNVRFFDDVAFRDLRFTGDTESAEISFEDARFSKDLEFTNIDFGAATLNCFQMVVGDFVGYVDRRAEGRPVGRRRVRLVNIDISEDAAIDFTDAEMDGTDIIFENISKLPETRVCLAPIKYLDDPRTDICPSNYLQFKNCGIEKTLHIGNVSELSFADSSNYGKITGAANWGSTRAVNRRRMIYSGLRERHIVDPLLRAVYYDTHGAERSISELGVSKARDFVMLKENYSAAGKYDAEDEAFILHMQFKPYLNYRQRRHRGKSGRGSGRDPLTSALYGLLAAVGNYGISPFRVVISLAVLIIAFTGIYYAAAVWQGAGAFGIGSTQLGALQPELCWGNVLPAFVYSLGNVVPFVSQFEPISRFVLAMTAAENAMGSFLVGYFSVAVVRKTLR